MLPCNSLSSAENTAALVNPSWKEGCFQPLGGAIAVAQGGLSLVCATSQSVPLTHARALDRGLGTTDHAGHAKAANFPSRYAGEAPVPLQQRSRRISGSNCAAAAEDASACAFTPTAPSFLALVVLTATGKTACDGCPPSAKELWMSLSAFRREDDTAFGCFFYLSHRVRLTAAGCRGEHVR